MRSIQGEAAAARSNEPQINHARLLSAVYAKAKARLEARRHIPTTTYRLQFNRLFTFRDARKAANYIRKLEVSDVYASPYFKARANSMHGYDIINHNELNPSLGSEAVYEAFVEELHRHGLGQILDIVPNHMGIGEESSTWWTDVLENGRSSLYASYFDIDWEPLNTKLTHKVLLPVLSNQYGARWRKWNCRFGSCLKRGASYCSTGRIRFRSIRARTRLSST